MDVHVALEVIRPVSDECMTYLNAVFMTCSANHLGYYPVGLYLSQVIETSMQF